MLAIGPTDGRHLLMLEAFRNDLTSLIEPN
jgi:hypothetical protein